MSLGYETDTIDQEGSIKQKDMRIDESCAACLYDKQRILTDDQSYLREIRTLLENRKDSDTSAYMLYLFDQVHKKYFGKGADYSKIKKRYNDFVLSKEETLQKRIEAAEDPLAEAIAMSRFGNYIDFAAMSEVDTDEFMKLFNDTKMSEEDRKTYASFLEKCERGKNFLLIADNCGEIVLDKLLVRTIKKRFPPSFHKGTRTRQRRDQRCDS